MRHIRPFIYLLVLSLTLFSTPGFTEENPDHSSGLHLSKPLVDLLRAEMRALLDGIQSLPASIALADWKQAAETSHKISSSYILAQKLTPAQKQELQHKLPEYFKKIDANFHAQANKLHDAAMNHDAQLSTFYYYRLLDTCTSCHAAYATNMFPGFSAPEQDEHHH